MYEHLLIDEDNLVETENERIFVAQMGEIDVDEMSRKINGVIEKAYEESRDIREEIKGIVPEYNIKVEQEEDINQAGENDIKRAEAVE